MRQIRACEIKSFNSGVSGCPIQWEKIKGAILLEHGQKLPKDLTGVLLETACHADRPTRIYPVMTFVEYAKNGGEPQASATGYGGMQVTGVSALTHTFTLDNFYDSLNANLLGCKNKKWDVYFFDKKNFIYGVNDGSELLAGIPMSTVYATPTPFPTSGAKAAMTVSFAVEDSEEYYLNYDYMKMDFDVKDNLIGLAEVSLVTTTTGGNTYKIIEKVGGYDRTEEFGAIIAAAAADVMSGVTTATYKDGVLTITASASATPALKAPSVLYAKHIKGIEQV